MSFEPEDSTSTCLPWRLPSSGRLEGGDVTPCPVSELTAAAPQLDPGETQLPASLSSSVSHALGAECWAVK